MGSYGAMGSYGKLWEAMGSYGKLWEVAMGSYWKLAMGSYWKLAEQSASDENLSTEGGGTRRRCNRENLHTSRARSRGLEPNSTSRQA